ncbi:hypothetical protein MRX96_019914 [Rhipicephalus microplus]
MNAGFRGRAQWPGDLLLSRFGARGVERMPCNKLIPPPDNQSRFSHAAHSQILCRLSGDQRAAASRRSRRGSHRYRTRRRACGLVERGDTAKVLFGSLNGAAGGRGEGPGAR